MSTLKCLLLTILLLGLSACANREIRLPAVPNINPGPPDYEDLRPGETLRLILPILKPGYKSPVLKSEMADGRTISVSAEGLIGYQTVIYSIAGKRGGRVQLKFVSAERTENGRSISIPEPSLRFLSPRKGEYIRLIYLQRLSQSDHNMAIIVSKQKGDLVRLTMQIRRDPKSCITTQEARCSWVPAGVAVRPEEAARR